MRIRSIHVSYGTRKGAWFFRHNQSCREPGAKLNEYRRPTEASLVRVTNAFGRLEGMGIHVTGIFYNRGCVTVCASVQQ